MKKETIKTEIKEVYGNIAKENMAAGCCATNDFNSMSEGYSNVKGYRKEADLSLGCGLPTEIAIIKEGDTVIDLGSGAGNDVFIAREIVGEAGRVIGIDMTPQMVISALQNNQKLGYKNVEFVLGEVEEMKTINRGTADVVISNCVMNLILDKEKAFKEVFRVLRTGGHFSISDIVYTGQLPNGVLEAAELYAGCVAGASEKGAYLGIIKAIGFKNIQIKKERLIDLPDELLLKYLNKEKLLAFKNSSSGIYSITVYADKLEDGSCCETTEESCCGSELKQEDTDVAKTACCATTSTAGSSCC